MSLLSESLMATLAQVKSLIQMPRLISAYSFVDSHIHYVCFGECKGGVKVAVYQHVVEGVKVVV